MTVHWRQPDYDYDPKYLTCDYYSCPFKGTRQRVINVWDQPAHFVDPSTVYRLACGHETL